MARPILFLWTPGGMTPANGYQARIAHEEFELGQRYRLVEMEERSQASHAHQFAWLREAWVSLPEQFAEMPWAQSSEALRKYALIKTGYCDVRSVACGSNSAALRVAALSRDLDPFSLALVEGSTCTVMTAQSQSKKAMGKERFYASKQAILEFIAGLIGVDAETLQKQANAA